MLKVCQEHTGFSYSIWWWTRISFYEKILPCWIPSTTYHTYFIFLFGCCLSFLPFACFNRMEFTPGFWGKSHCFLFSLFFFCPSLCFFVLHSGPFVFCNEAFLLSSYWGMNFDPVLISTALRVFFLSPLHGLRAVISSCLWSSCFYLGPG